MAIAVILGSSFSEAEIEGMKLVPTPVETEAGHVILFRHPERDDAYVLFRHGVPHRYLPHQIPYHAHADALKRIRCGALLITSSVGVLDAKIPLGEPLAVSDLLMLDNRLPDGRACTMFHGGYPGQGHLVIKEGLFSAELGSQVDGFARDAGTKVAGRVVFSYNGGPRTKTPAENRFLSATGAQVNSMTLGPEVVLANELSIPVTAIVVGHKYSVSGGAFVDESAIAASLEKARRVLAKIVLSFLESAAPVEFRNEIFRF